MSKSASISRDMAARVPALRALALFLTGDRERGDDLLAAAITWFFTDPPAAPPTITLEILMFAILHDLYCLGGCKSAGGWDTPAAQAIGASRLVSDQFRSAFWRLGGDERELLMLAEASGLSGAEVAQICGCTPAAVAAGVARAWRKLAPRRSAARSERSRDRTPPAHIPSY